MEHKAIYHRVAYDNPRDTNRRAVRLRWKEIGIEAIIVNFRSPKTENIKRVMEDGIKDLWENKTL